MLITKEFESAAKKDKILFHSEIIESRSMTKAITWHSKSKKIDPSAMGVN